MNETKLKDFIELNFVGRFKDNNQIFDLTSEELAKKEKLYNPQAKYGPKIICLGENHILKALDKFLVDKEIGKSYKLDLKPQEAFGKKDPKFIKIVNIDVLRKQNINPFPGLQINASGLMATVRSVTGGRVTLDFNHPLAGKNITYEVTINKIITENKEKLISLVENLLELGSKDYSLELQDKKVKLKLKA